MLTNTAISAAACVVALALAMPAAAGGFRLEGGLGGTFSQNDARASVTTGAFTATLNSDAIGGSGLAASGALWWDGGLARMTGNPIMENVSLGVEYRRFENDTTSTASASSGGVSGTAQLTSSVSSDNLLFNLALRYNPGNMHPFVGGGIGVAFSDLSATGSVATIPPLPAGTPTSATISASSTNFAAQAFVGFDLDLGPSWYVGATGVYHMTERIGKSIPFASASVEPRQLAILGRLGVKF